MYMPVKLVTSTTSSTGCSAGSSTSLICVVINLLNMLSSLINSVVSFISQNADVFAVVVGVGAILGLAERIPFFSQLISLL